VKRRDFIKLLGGAALAWPLSARAQQLGKLPTIGFLGPNTLAAGSEWVAALVQRLRELGWIENRTIAIERFWRCGARTIRSLCRLVPRHSSGTILARLCASSTPATSPWKHMHARSLKASAIS
jgi:hypothetical protein